MSVNKEEINDDDDDDDHPHNVEPAVGVRACFYHTISGLHVSVKKEEITRG